MLPRSWPCLHFRASLCSSWVSISVLNLKSNSGRKGFVWGTRSRSHSIIKGSQGRNSRQEPESRAKCCLWLIPQGLLSPLTRTSRLRSGTAHSGLDPPTSTITDQELPLRLFNCTASTLLHSLFVFTEPCIGYGLWSHTCHSEWSAIMNEEPTASPTSPPTT